MAKKKVAKRADVATHELRSDVASVVSMLQAQVESLQRRIAALEYSAACREACKRPAKTRTWSDILPFLTTGGGR